MLFKFSMKGISYPVLKMELRDYNMYKIANDAVNMTLTCDILGIEKSYGFEYLGNNPRIVITPLTERC